MSGPPCVPIERLEDSLALRVRYKGREHSGRLWISANLAYSTDAADRSRQHYVNSILIVWTPASTWMSRTRRLRLGGITLTSISAALQTRKADMARVGHLGVDPKRTEQVLLGDVMTAHGVPGNGPVFHQSMGISFDQPAEPVQMERDHGETPVEAHENHSG